MCRRHLQMGARREGGGGGEGEAAVRGTVRTWHWRQVECGEASNN